MIIFPMAGLSSRFQKAGYTMPKYMLPLGTGSMLQAVVRGFSSIRGTEPFLFICRDVSGTKSFIQSQLTEFAEKPNDVGIVTLDNETSGQAETVYLGLKRGEVSKDTPITIFNIDSQHQQFRYPLEFDVGSVDGYLEVFRAEGDHWSFVLPDHASARIGAVAEVAEKRRISDLCSTGLYFFRRAGLFMDLYEETLSAKLEELDGGERYVAPLYNSAIKQGYDIRYSEISREGIAFTGTPEEYEQRRMALEE